MHRLDDTLMNLDRKLKILNRNKKRNEVQREIAKREAFLLPVYEQIAVKFCELHDTPGRMKAVGAIRKELEWSMSRIFFYWRLRRKLAEFDLRKKVIEAGNVGKSLQKVTPIEASALIKQWFHMPPSTTLKMW